MEWIITFTMLGDLCWMLLFVTIFITHVRNCVMGGTPMDIDHDELPAHQHGIIN